MKILGISNNLGAGAALIINGKIECAIHEERLTRNKDFKGFPLKSINYIFKKYKINYSSLDFVTYGVAIPYKKNNILEIKQSLKKNNQNSKLIDRRIHTEKNWINNHINDVLYFAKKYRFIRKLSFIEHHLSHAAASFFTSPFKKSYICFYVLPIVLAITFHFLQ